MRIALLASGPVGHAAARALRAHDGNVVCLMLDPRGDEAENGRIRAQFPALGDADVLTDDRRSDEEKAELLRKLQVDLAILAWWPYIVGPAVLGAPRLGCLNFHPSLLPHNRGTHPNFWALVEEAPYGVTIHFATADIDGGDIAFQAPLEVSWEDTGGSLHRRACEEIVRLFERHLPDILRGDIPRRRQEPGAGSFHRRAELDPASRVVLDGEYRARELLNLLRARTFPPHPAAWFEDDGVRYEVRVEVRRVGGPGSP